MDYYAKNSGQQSCNPVQPGWISSEDTCDGEKIGEGQGLVESYGGELMLREGQRGLSQVKSQQSAVYEQKNLLNSRQGQRERTIKLKVPEPGRL